MTKKHFIALAEHIKRHSFVELEQEKRVIEITDLADFCQSVNPNFNRERWLSYVAGECGPNGGKSGKK